MLDIFHLILARPDLTREARVQFPGEEHDFFSSFKLFFLSIFCMHLYHILINWSQKFWVVYVQYRFIYEQCGLLVILSFRKCHLAQDLHQSLANPAEPPNDFLLSFVTDVLSFGICLGFGLLQPQEIEQLY